MILKKEKNKEQSISDLPRMSPSYLTRNNLWDSHWLEKIHPETFYARRELNKQIKEAKENKINKENAKNKS